MTDTNRLSSKQHEMLTLATRKNLMAFSMATQKNYQVNWHHELIANKLIQAVEKVKKGKRARVIIEVPPRHGKSELATIKFPAWLLGNYPEMQFIVSSYSGELAQDFGQKTRDLMQSDEYKSLFTTRLKKDSKAKGKWHTNHGGSYTSTGVGGAVTGRGFNVGIIDDPLKNREEAESDTIREKVWNWYTSTFYTRQEGNSAIVVIMTRWHTDDLVGRLLQKQEEDRLANKSNYDKWEVIRFPAIAEEDEPPYRLKDEPLWPNKFDIHALDNIKNAVGLYDWHSLYQQTPVASETQEFHESFFRYFNEEDLENKNLEYFTTVDPAISQNEKADNTVILTVGKERNNPNWYRIEETADHLTPLQTIDAIFAHQQKYRSSVWVETNAYQQSLRYFIEEEQRKRQQYFIVNELRQKNKKEERIRGLVPLYATGVIFHRHSDHVYEQELLTFPVGKRDDRIDAMAMQLQAQKPTLFRRRQQIKRKKSKNNPFR